MYPLIGYGEKPMGYKLYNPVTQKIIFSRDVIFDENKSWNWDQVEFSSDTELILEEEEKMVQLRKIRKSHWRATIT